jgi:hypothetical protein
VHVYDGIVSLESIGVEEGKGGKTNSLSCALASWLIFSKSWLLRRGLIALASSWSNTSSPSFNSTRGCSRGTIIVPLDLRDTSLGREMRCVGVVLPSSWAEEDEDVDVELLRCAAVRSGTTLGAEVVGEAILLCVCVVAR